MKKKYTLHIFPTRSLLGQELASEVKDMAEVKYGFNVTVNNNATPWQFIKICGESDVVILDATLEADADQHNYSFATPTNTDNLLIVARSYVPLNFQGIREGGTAKYSDTDTPIGQKTNKSIISWLETELNDLCNQHKSKSIFANLIPSPIYLLIEQKRAISNKQDRLKAQNLIFISYRSTNYHQVKGFVNKARSGSYGNKYKNAFMFFFDPGELVFEDELLSPLRRWQLLSIIQDYIIAASEVIIFGSNNYFYSWWTLGEVLSVIEFTNKANIENKLKFFDPLTDSVNVVETSFLPLISKAQKNRMARFQVNSHPGMMAPEVLDRNTLLEPVSDVSVIKKIFMLDDPVFSKEFWEYYVVPCKSKKCSPVVGVTYKQNLSRFHNDLRNIDIDNFLKMWHEGELIVTLEELARSAQGIDNLICSKCQTPINISEEKPRYLWVPQLFTANQENIWGRLEQLPVYRACSQEK